MSRQRGSGRTGDGPSTGNDGAVSTARFGPLEDGSGNNEGAKARRDDVGAQRRSRRMITGAAKGGGLPRRELWQAGALRLLVLRDLDNAWRAAVLAMRGRRDRRAKS
jgi:hypothetical protein